MSKASALVDVSKKRVNPFKELWTNKFLYLLVGSLVSLAIVLSALPGFLYLADPLIIKKKKQPKEA